MSLRARPARTEPSAPAASSAVPPRRPFLRRLAWGGMALGALGALGALVGSASGCARSELHTLRYGAPVFPGYEMLYLARALREFSEEDIRLIETPSVQSNVRAIASGAMEGASMTLDEVLTANERGLDLKVVAVIDVSVGADALLARPGLGSLRALRGRTVGVEQTAVGAVMLDAALASADLKLADITVRHVTYDDHAAAYSNGLVDAIVSYEPMRSQLLGQGAQVLFSSDRIPGRIVDVIALRADYLARQPQNVGRLVASHFRGREAWASAPARHASLMAPRLGQAPENVARLFEGLQLADLAQNQRWFAEDAAQLQERTHELAAVMMRAGLLRQRPAIDRLFDGRFL